MDQTETQPWGPLRPAREPMFNAPWTIVVLCVGLIALYAVQSFALNDAKGQPPAALTLTGAALAAGHLETLVTSLFLHGSWPHVLMNSVAALAFGPPVARLMGLGPRGALVFLLFYLVCGIVGGLGFVLADPRESVGVVGASGAISGLLGAASRIIQGHGRIGPIFGQTVIGMAIAWVIVNVVLGLLPPGWSPGTMGMSVAWQAHIAGFAAGALLIGPFARLAGRGPEDFTQ